MAKQIVGNLRKSSSLIVLARDQIKARHPIDFKALMFKRPPQATFMPNCAVFPGGVLDAQADETPLWRKHFENMGVSRKQLSLLTQGKAKKSNIFTKEDPESLERELSLRIAAIRETFEELGVIFCQNRETLAKGAGEGYGNFKEDFDRQHWQMLVHNDATQFLKLCETLEIIPDLWNLYEWSNWLTPATLKKRFDTVFFVIAIQKMPHLIKEKHEVTDFSWNTPSDFLRQHFEKEIWLPPPQFYELSRLLNFSELEKVKNFAQTRAMEGLDAIFPVERKCKDGRVSLFQGDDLYENPDLPELVSISKTAKEYREGIQNLHRIEFYDSNKMAMQVNVDVPNGHICPVNTNPEDMN
ncbi:acyl-coenzyme A diphosphatase NUDT19 [Stomoxys calcitrans]|uniref:acyl-coenzyme A diphosphatase NUDT19 n=1 Tax=Stomoxys calcitrans TaxID=35570 RepID=UPI0027E30BA7|nr:acyl-coenzyme A diphosphatase NUDT19 [Stomoxys calcitrans]